MQSESSYVKSLAEIGCLENVNDFKGLAHPCNNARREDKMVARSSARRWPVSALAGTMALGLATPGLAAEAAPAKLTAKLAGLSSSIPLDTNKDGINATRVDLAGGSDIGPLSVQGVAEFVPTQEPRTCPNGQQGIDLRALGSVTTVTLASSGASAFLVADKITACLAAKGGLVFVTIDGHLARASGRLARLSGAFRLAEQGSIIVTDPASNAVLAVRAELTSIPGKATAPTQEVPSFAAPP